MSPTHDVKIKELIALSVAMMLTYVGSVVCFFLAGYYAIPNPTFQVFWWIGPVCLLLALILQVRLVSRDSIIWSLCSVAVILASGPLTLAVMVWLGILKMAYFMFYLMFFVAPFPVLAVLLTLAYLAFSRGLRWSKGWSIASALIPSVLITGAGWGLLVAWFASGLE